MISDKIKGNHLENHIITKTLEGVPQRTIAKELNTSQTTISHYINKPEIKSLTQRLRNTLQQKHVHKFIARVVKTEKQAAKVNDYALGLTNDNPTRYESIDEQEKLLTRCDKTGLNILKGVGILDTNTMHVGDTNTSNVTVVTPAFQQFIDFQASEHGVKHPNSEPIDGDNGAKSND